MSEYEPPRPICGAIAATITRKAADFDSSRFTLFRARLQKDVPRNVPGPVPAQLFRKSVRASVASCDELSSPADFYAGLRDCPLARKSCFCFARTWFKWRCEDDRANAVVRAEKSRKYFSHDLQPADFYAGLRYNHLAMKSGFCVAPPWFK